MLLNGLPNIGPVTIKRLLDAFGPDPRRILEADVDELKTVKGVSSKIARVLSDHAKHFDLEFEKRKLSEMGGDFVDHQSDEYPELLRKIYDPPLGLYRLGSFSLRKNQVAIAIVGSRRTSMYGQRIARQFAQRLASIGVCVVSGLARGIDTVAHEGALDAGGDTIAVLGNGLDIVYPPENLELYRKIREKGAIFSEFTLGRRADRQTFPMRNRIVSGICDGVLVVESDVNGGSMITARFAAEQGRQVYAIPGRIDQASSRGCHALIKDGAMMVTGVEDILDDLRHLSDLFPSAVQEGVEIETQKETSKNVFAEIKSAEGRKILKLLENDDALGLDEISDETGLPLPVVSAQLMMLELNRAVIKQLDGSFLINRGE